MPELGNTTIFSFKFLGVREIVHQRRPDERFTLANICHYQSWGRGMYIELDLNIERDHQKGNEYPAMNIQQWISSSEYPAMNIQQWISSSEYPAVNIQQWISSNEYPAMNTQQWISSNEYPAMVTLLGKIIITGIIWRFLENN